MMNGAESGAGGKDRTEAGACLNSFCTGGF